MSREEAPTIESIADPLERHVFPWLKNREVAALSVTCRFFHDLTARERQQRWQRTVNELIRHVVCGEEAEAKAMLERTPVLLLKTGVATDYSRRTVQATGFEAALCARDVEMCEMMMAIAENHGMAAELQAQFYKIFSDDVAAFAAQQEKDIFNFNDIVDAITNASDEDLQATLAKENNGSALCHALDEFRKQFSQRSREETIYNPYHLLAAFKSYNEKFEQIYNWKKVALFWRQVVGYVQCFLPACDAQDFAQGMYSIVNGNEVLRRNFTFRQPRDCSATMYPPKFDDGVGLGFDWHVTLSGRRHAGPALASETDACTLQNICQKKNRQLTEIYLSAAKWQAPSFLDS